MQNKRVLFIIRIIIFILCIPLVAMWFTDEVNWDFMDFLVAGIILFGTGLVSGIVMRNVKNINKKITLLVIIFIVVILIWMELAVGLFGTPFAGS